jgi:hypothetical protein
MQSKNHEDILFDSIYSSFIENLSSIFEKKDIDFIIDKTNKSKSFLKPICLLPYWFFNCFENENNIDLQNELFILGKTNLQYYISCNLYDLIRNGKIEREYINLSLSAANVLLQKSIKDFYNLVNYDKNKINIINNLLEITNTSHLDNKTISDIHYHFKYLCDNAYKKSIGMSITAIVTTWLLGFEINSNNHIETIEFFKNYLNAKQLSNDDDKMCDDMLNNTYTPATFLMRAQYSSDYIHTMIRSRIDMNMRAAIDSLRNLAFFDYERFMELYVR